jgi:thiamine pyrophosphate-dependent acetolactate synthase large subunit-like protein
MDWCEDNGLDYVFGLPGNKILAAAVEDKADDIATSCR